jgi:NAD(P)-dependent dehydrogenase (short-subunit alcohol dehydrogenase family)
MSDFLGFPDRSVVVVTGAASGIGEATAKLASSVGLAVSAWDIDLPRLEKVGAEITAAGGRLQALEVDISDTAAAASAFAKAGAELGPVGLLVNNAGPTSTLDLGFQNGVSKSLGVLGTVTEAWLRTDGAHDGVVVNVASVAGTLTGAGMMSWYPAAKAGIAGYTRWLAAKRPAGIRANAVAPGSTVTPRNQTEGTAEGERIKARIPMRAFAQPRDIAAAIIFLLSPAAGHINGVLLPVDGGTTVAW